ncbi:gamma-glutamyl-phosphate reductase, partial [Desulfovibrio oxamicus]|nr:gamma-glutamyl-phosphate reductase [Nitratidesulfovibrio oxamicus]
MGKRAKAAARKLAAAAPAVKIDALLRLAGLLESREADILAANAR